MAQFLDLKNFEEAHGAIPKHNSVGNIVVLCRKSVVTNIEINSLWGGHHITLN